MVLRKLKKWCWINRIFILALWGFMNPTKSINAQDNLIFNGDCELYDTCPNNTSQIRFLRGWNNLSYWSSADYMNTCSQNLSSSAPSSSTGYQKPHTGNGYIQIGNIVCKQPQNYLTRYTTEDNGFIEIRENFIASLTRPLRQVPHYLEYYVSFAKIGTCYTQPGTSNDGRFANNAFDILLMKEKELIYNGCPPYTDPYRMIKVVKDNTIIKDTLNWVKLSVCFVPDGGEQFIAFGAFRDTTEIVYEYSGCEPSDPRFLGFYYFDSFSLTECDTCCLGEFPYTDHLTMQGNPGPAGQLPTFKVLINPNSSAQLGIYDSAGRLVFSETFQNLYTEYQPQQQLAAGIYHYRFSTSNGAFEVGKVLVVE